jgi:dTDP-4-dehydrorhamnose 3,5-epimerase
MINGVEIKMLSKHTDPRGYFMELIRKDDAFFRGFGQWSESKMVTGTIKAWHIHQIQVDYWRVPVGLVRAVLCDLRPDSSTYRLIDEYLLGDDQEPRILRIPPGVAHGCKVLQGPALLTYVTSHTYNPEDEGRIAYDDEQIGYDWVTEVIK